MVNGHAMATAEARTEPRDEVMHRTRGSGPDGGPLSLVIVNMSPRGLMARCEIVRHVGDRIRVQLPVVGQVSAVIRWSLGGRIGCELDHPIPLSTYYSLLATMLRNS